MTKLRIRDLLTDEEYVKQRRDLEREQIRIARSLETAGQADARFEPARLLVSFSNGAVSRFHAGDLATKRLILGVVGSNPVLTDKKLSIDARKPFRRWSKTGNYSDWCSFVKDVRTLAAAGAMAETIAAVREILRPIRSQDPFYSS